MQLLNSAAGVSKLMSSADFDQDGIDIETADKEGGAVLSNLGIAVVSCDPQAANAINVAAVDDSAILAVEPERIAYATGQEGGCGGAQGGTYLQGYADGVAQLCDNLTSRGQQPAGSVADQPCFQDDDESTWGLKATKVDASKYSGRGISVAVLDTGIDEEHPDFSGRNVTGKSFINGQDVDDKNGHGTHCTGTACGPESPGSVRRYGAAYNSSIFIGKVLSNSGSGSFGGILAGIDWAVTNECQVISMSLGASVRPPSPAFEAAGERALQAGSLIVAAAGNNADRAAGNFGFVGIPANSRSIMAVGALDHCLAIANFSARSSGLSGGEVDIAGPGVNVFSSWPLPLRYRSISGTSMATPHVAGIAALFAEAYRARGYQLWQLLTSSARRLPLPSVDQHLGDLDQVAEACRNAGLESDTQLKMLGQILGEIAVEDEQRLRSVPGVMGVEESGEIQLPPPDSDIQ
eukprot:g33064.t1